MSKTLRHNLFTLTACLCCCVLALFTSACIRNEFTVTVSLPSAINNTYRVVYYAHDKRGGFTQETAITVAKGHGEMKGITRLPTCVLIFEGSSLSPAAAFYVERGDKIEITGESASPYKWEIKGNDLTDELSEWRLENANLISLNNIEGVNAAVEKYVSANPENPLSALLIALYYDRRFDSVERSENTGKKGQPGKTLSGMEQLIAKLRGKAADESLLNITGRSDMILHEEASRNRTLPNRIILQTDGNGVDTVSLAGGKPSLLLVRRYSADGDYAAMDSLKSALRQYRDSARRNIVELYLAADSSSWQNAISHDTLRGAVRARMPREYAEPLLMEAGITRAPWLIVTDGKGKIRYYGPSPAKALATFRSLMR